MNYGQFCPIAKATEILGERWTFLIIRELLMGGRRFSELQRGLGDISPALLTARLKAFENRGLVVRRRINGLRGFEYHPTLACEDLMPIIIALGEWGLCWARKTLATDYLNIDLLLLYLERSVDPRQLPGRETVFSSSSTISPSSGIGGCSSATKRWMSASARQAGTSMSSSRRQPEP